MKDIVIVSAARTPFGNFGGSLKDVTPTELGTIAAKGAIERAGVSAEWIDNVVIGNVIHSAKDAPYVSRRVALGAGVPYTSPALTINRLCGSGLQAVVNASQSIRLGESELALAGGTENMSMAPYHLRGARFGTGLGIPDIDDALSNALTHDGLVMGVTAEKLAETYGISREAQDEFALESQRRASRAREAGVFAEEIIPVTVKSKKKEFVMEHDEYIRADTSLETLSKLRPVFKADGTVTSGNASGINDGAAVVLLASEEFATRNNLKPLARIMSWAVSGVDPAMMGIGPVPASQLALKRAGLKLEDMDLIEVNEAFAVQCLSVENLLGLHRDITNVNGGATAIGHPVAASGARVLMTAVFELHRRKKRYALSTLCIGGGQGIAMIVEVL